MDLEQMLNLMTERQRQVVRLWLAGMKQADIAKELGISQQAVSDRLRRALKRKNMKKLLKK